MVSPNMKEVTDWIVQQRRKKWEEYLNNCAEIYHERKEDWDFAEKNKPKGISKELERDVSKLLFKKVVVTNNGMIYL